MMETGGVEASHGASADKDDVGAAESTESAHYDYSYRGRRKYLDSAMMQ